MESRLPPASTVWGLAVPSYSCLLNITPSWESILDSFYWGFWLRSGGGWEGRGRGWVRHLFVYVSILTLNLGPSFQKKSIEKGYPNELRYPFFWIISIPYYAFLRLGGIRLLLLFFCIRSIRQWPSPENLFPPYQPWKPIFWLHPPYRFFDTAEPVSEQLSQYQERYGKAYYQGFSILPVFWLQPVF